MDQETTNGSWLKGEALEGRAPARLESGDYLLLGGSVRAMFLLPEDLRQFATEHSQRTPP